MEKWSFNCLLLSHISDALELSEAAIARRCGMTQAVLNRYTRQEIVLSVQVLIKICNTLRIPASFFVSKNANHVIPARGTMTVNPQTWQPVEWDSEAVELTFGDKRINWKDVAKVMGVTSQRPHDRFLLHTRFPVTDFFKVCNHYEISPFRFLIDNNGEHKEKRSMSSRKEFKNEIDRMSKQISRLSDTVADLTKKYEELLEAHNSLAKRVNVNINTINNSYIGIAAEPNTNKS